MFPPSAVKGGWNGGTNGLAWRAVILPQMELNNQFNSINFNIAWNNGQAAVLSTIWYTTINVFLCPSDATGQSPPGYVPYGSVSPTGTYSVVAPPDTTRNYVPVTNYMMSFGDNYAIYPLVGANPWETAGTATPPNPQIGWNGFWGTNNSGGTMRGFADYSTGGTATMASVTDGTSNTIIVGEGLPAEDANSEMWGFTGTACGVTIPINWKTANYASPCAGNYNSTDFTCRFSYAARGFKSRHPGGANFLFADGSVRFLKNSVNRVTYAALGSRNGGEVVSSDAY